MSSRHSVADDGTRASAFAGVTNRNWQPRVCTASQERMAMAIAQQQGVPEIVARLLVGRGVGVDEAYDFLHPTLKNSLPDPAHLHDMDKAVARIIAAMQAGEKIAVFGDYDVDGATSSALLKRYFAQLGHELVVYIPDRMKEGYGPNLAAFDALADQGVSLIITVDCGTVSFEPIAAAKARGVDVIVIDHHMAQAQLPDAVAVVNPNRIDQDSDCGNLAAVGVVFLLLVALNKALRELSPTVCRSLRARSNWSTAFAGSWQTDTETLKEPNLLNYLDLVALGTVCDVVALKGLNRALVSQGLKVMAQRRNIGLAAIADVARMDDVPGAYHLGFLIGPRINAGGRVGESGLGSVVLSSDDRIACEQIAARLDAYNEERRAIEASVLEQALDMAESQENQPCIIVAREGWHEGVIGIVAGRLKEEYSRPALVISLKDGVGKGSARSVGGADIGAAVTSAKLEGMLLAGGGHAMAAGFSLDVARLDDFAAFMHARLEQAVADYQLGRVYHYDGEVAASGASLALIDALEQAGPFGMGNPAPRLVVPNVKIVDVARMKDKHLRAVAVDAGGGGRLKAVAFNCVGTPLGDVLENHAGRALSLAGQLKRNRWQGVESVQLMIDDIAC